MLTCDSRNRLLIHTDNLCFKVIAAKKPLYEFYLDVDNMVLELWQKSKVNK